jgi:hypothetical protein
MSVVGWHGSRTQRVTRSLLVFRQHDLVLCPFITEAQKRLCQLNSAKTLSHTLSLNPSLVSSPQLDLCNDKWYQSIQVLW